MDTVIRTRNLSKRFDSPLRRRSHGSDPAHDPSWALRDVNLTVEAGQVHGFLGPNGAGKSTTIRVLLGLLKASEGSAEVFGMDAWKERVQVHKRLASVPGDVSLWPQLSGGEALDVLTRLRGADPASVRVERERLVDVFGLDVRKKCHAYSKGNRQKVALVSAFAVPADLYIFDEPTSGLDPLMEQVFRDEVARVVARGATVLLSSHILSEVEQLCDSLSIIRAGHIVETGTLEQMRHLRRSEVRWSGPAAPAGLPVHDVVATGIAGEHRASAEAADLPAVLSWLGQVRAEAVSVNPTSLEELFLRHYAGDGGGVEPGRGSAEPVRTPRHARSSAEAR